MVEISPPRIESISDASAGPQEQNAPQHRAKAAAVGKASPPRPPEVGTPEDSEKHELDEMA
jgi:hypothetical protein